VFTTRVLQDGTRDPGWGSTVSSAGRVIPAATREGTETASLLDAEGFCGRVGRHNLPTDASTNRAGVQVARSAFTAKRSGATVRWPPPAIQTVRLPVVSPTPRPTPTWAASWSVRVRDFDHDRDRSTG